jgi:hypothetical protein
MPAKAQLMALGQPAASAHALGYDAPANITSAGAGQATAAVLTSTYSTVAGTAGVRLPAAATSGPVLLFPAAASTVYPAGSDFINQLAPGAGFLMTANRVCYLIPNGAQWMAIVSAS